MKLAFGTTGLVGGPSRSDGQQVLQAPRMELRTANTARPECVVSKVRRWACCGLRRTGGPSPELWGVFIIAVHRAFVLGLGAQHRGIVKLSEGG